MKIRVYYEDSVKALIPRQVPCHRGFRFLDFSQNAVLSTKMGTVLGTLSIVSISLKNYNPVIKVIIYLLRLLCYIEKEV